MFACIYFLGLLRVDAERARSCADETGRLEPRAHNQSETDETAPADTPLREAAAVCQVPGLVGCSGEGAQLLIAPWTSEFSEGS